MIRKFILLILCTSSLFASNPLVPQTPVVIADDPLVTNSVSVAAAPAGFVAVWNDNDHIVYASSSSNNGVTWSAPVLLSVDSSAYALVSVKGSSFLASWVHIDPGFTSGEAYVSLSNDLGETWSSPVTISSLGGEVAPPVVTCANHSGFMAIWAEYNSGWFPFTSFSADGITWSTPVQVSLIDIPYDYVRIAGNDQGFLATWPHYNGPDYQLFSSFSSDNGATWSTPVLITDSIVNGISAPCFGTSGGFIVTWTDSSNVGYSNFSTDNGATWSTPSVIANNAANFFNISISGTDAGLVAAFNDEDNMVNASFSSNNGTTWSAPVSITGPSAVHSPIAEEFIGVSALSTNCMFTWWGADGMPMSSYSIFPGSAPPSPETNNANSGAFKQITPNKPGKTLF